MSRQFSLDYVKVRAADGHGDVIARNFRRLPDVDPGAKHYAIWEIRRRSYETLIRRVLPQFGAGLRILDLGAGIGWLCARLSELGHEPFALDVSIAGVDGLAASLAFDPTWPLVQADFDQLPIAPASFDIAVFNGSFHYSADYTATLQEAMRVIKANGAVVIMDTPIYRSAASGEQMKSEMRASLRKLHGIEPAPCRQFLTWDELMTLGSELGLSWQVHRPAYGISWALRPWLAAIRGTREPATFAVLLGRPTV